MKEMIIGADVGGTTVKFGLFTADGTLIEKWNIPTDISDGGSHVIPDIAQSIEEKLKTLPGTGLKGIGIGLPGPVDKGGRCLGAVNLNWTSACDPADELKKRFGVPVAAANDANAAALGEAWMGAGKGCRDLLFAGLGTGIGCGIILDGKILTGAHGSAGEMGHMVMDSGADAPCSCGKKGCVERYASANGMARYAKEYVISQGLDPKEVFGTGTVDSIVLFKAARTNEKADEALGKVCDLLGRTLAAGAALTDPEIIVIGGGVVNAGEALFERVIPAYKKYAFHSMKDTPIVPAGLGSDAGIYGAARLTAV